MLLLSLIVQFIYAVVNFMNFEFIEFYELVII